MDHSSDSPPLIPTPRHLRRRRFRAEIPDPLLVPGGIGPRPGKAVPVPDAEPHGARVPAKTRATATPYAIKRRIAFVMLVLVGAAIPALIAALVLAK